MRFKPWNISWAIRNIIRTLFGMKSLEQERMEKMQYIRELLSASKSDIVQPSSTKEYFEYLAKNFTISTIVVAKKDGSVIASNLDSSKTTAEVAKQIYNKIKGQLPTTKYLLIKSEDKVHVVYPEGNLLYIIEAQGMVLPVEAKILAKQVKKGIR